MQVLPLNLPLLGSIHFHCKWLTVAKTSAVFKENEGWIIIIFAFIYATNAVDWAELALNLYTYLTVHLYRRNYDYEVQPLQVDSIYPVL